MDELEAQADEHRDVVTEWTVRVAIRDAQLDAMRGRLRDQVTKQAATLPTLLALEAGTVALGTALQDAIATVSMVKDVADERIAQLEDDLQLEQRKRHAARSNLDDLLDGAFVRFGPVAGGTEAKSLEQVAVLRQRIAAMQQVVDRYQDEERVFEEHNRIFARTNDLAILNGEQHRLLRRKIADLHIRSENLRKHARLVDARNHQLTEMVAALRASALRYER